MRDLALFNLAIDSKLRACDLLHLRVEDVMQGDQVQTRALVSQRKAGAPVQFEITEQARAAVAAWVRGKDLKGSDWLFPSRVDRTQPMTTRQYGRLVDDWIAAIGLSPSPALVPCGTALSWSEGLEFVAQGLGKIRAGR